ncbi:MAG: ATP-dependent DNA helicase RecG [Phycisphaerales bacterium]|nr:ATP-dependent DNA helicase RecG [Phycisphaerales bacterium]
MATDSLELTTLVDDLPGVDVHVARGLNALGLRCVADLLLHLPLRHERLRFDRSIADLTAQIDQGTLPKETIEIEGEIVSVRPGFRRRTPTEARLDDGTGVLTLTFFNQPWMARKLVAGSRVLVRGEPRLHRGQIQMTNPNVGPPAPQSPLLGAPAERSLELRPIYPASEAVSSSVIASLIGNVLDDAVALVEDHLSDDFRVERNLPQLADAWRTMHRPEHLDDVPGARRRLAYDELLLLQTGVAMRRHRRHTTLHAPPLPVTDEIVQRIESRLPFDLTQAQRRVLGEIAADLSESVPMHRLLQGDVGSGKTAVAVAAMLLAVARNAQAVLVAPTELLAEQHMGTIRTMLDDSSVQFELLTGSTAPATRRVLLERLREGDIDILVGTHALFGEGVIFSNLALAVIDEQHRFGVHQRAVLHDAAADPDGRPHQLVMTATPIPRTMSLSIFGDLEVSIIDERPPGRRPITTRHVGVEERDRVYEHMAGLARQGQQGWVVVPVIDEGAAELTSLRAHLDALASGPLAGLRVEAMHGRLKAAQRDEIMDRFRQGELDVLVCTTVIEVGVDVPGATMIVIEDADRFGLAQLHQLRGRVGRGDKPGLCVLVSDPTTEEGRARLEAMVETDDGFRIAERDLAIRGPGELFGIRQSGMPPFLVADLQRDRELLRMARTDAFELIEADPELEDQAHALLRRRLFKAHGQWMGLGDVG